MQRTLPVDDREPRNDTTLEDTLLLETVLTFRYLRDYRKSKHAQTE